MMGASYTTESAVQYLVPPDTAIETRGQGTAFELGALAGKQVLIVLRINEVMEQESLDISLWGSADGQDWGAKPLFSFAQKFYPGTAPAAVDLRQRAEIKFLQVRWDANRWGRGYPRPYFKFEVEIQELAAQ
jgi:hypothetical protein